MRFWDSSSIPSLVVADARTVEILRLLRFDQQMVVWWGSHADCVAAVRAAERNGDLDGAAVSRALALLEDLARAWVEVLPGPRLRSLAERCASLHPLRAGPALQLAAALTWSQGDPSGDEVVTLDPRLADAARREGFRVFPE